MSTTTWIGIVLLALAADTAFAQKLVKKTETARADAQITSGGTAGNLNSTPAKPALDKPSAHVVRPERSDKPGKSGPSDQVKKIMDDIQSSKNKFVDDQNDLQRKLKDATEDQKDKIRSEMRDKRDAFLEQQKEMREEFKKRVNELKDQLKDHQDVIDDAKEQAKQNSKGRKGGGN